MPAAPHAMPDVSRNNAAITLVNTGIAHIHQQRYREAMECLTQAIALEPGLGLAYFNRGVLFHHLLNREAMRADFVQAMQLEPDNFDIAYNTAAFFTRNSFNIEAIQAAQRAIELNPDHVMSWLILVTAYYELRNGDAVERLLTHLIQKFPNDPAVRIKDAFFLPPIPRSHADIDASRARFIQKIEQLTREGIHIQDPLLERHNSLFYLAYHGRPHKDISERIARFFLLSCPALAYVAPHCLSERKQPPAKIKIGFVSPTMHETTLNQFLLKAIEKMCENPDFEVVVFSNAPPLHPNVQALKKRLPRYIDLPMHLHDAQQCIAREAMDILFYMEVGGDPLMYALPFARLAHIQCVWGGLPVTTGIPNMDVFLSSSDCEPENAQVHYSEKLVMLTRTLAVYSRPASPVPAKSREVLGLPVEGDARLYACPVLLHKLHPDMDHVFLRILERDPKAKILLFDLKTTLSQNVLVRRFSEIMAPEYIERILFLPHVPQQDFPHMLGAVDCVLDTFHFSFGTTAYISIAANVPFVTLAGSFYAGRAGYRMFTRMDLPELIAATPEEFVDIAVKLASDKIFYNDMAKKMSERSDQFFDDYAIVDELAQRMKMLYFERE